ncbi:LacI family DNA-binding transcriptional regulator [Euzebyella saccharophila]|uniref:Substrate-binding domain-containing protein n=1 Tax=Euzebyella saccharophila TaxID=679664 RepID=A0ABV8JW30_9FLAO|nr:LacI family DNA-binding transcriptional regulator [Euzebyella saccharophila]
MSKKQHTIKDIARLAGVSKGTVDRVLHKRGKVSQKAHDKVKKVLSEIDYQPNPIARNLKRNKLYRICVLMPDWKIDPYWKPAELGIKEAIKEFKPFGVIVDQFLYHPHYVESFTTKSKEILASKPDVILMAPLFQEESISILKECREAKIWAALFNNYINTLNGEIFVGQDLIQSGKVAAGLVDKIVKNDSKIAVVHINKEAHMELKEDGFKSFFKEKNNSSHQILCENFNTEEEEEFDEQVSIFLKKNEDLKAIFITNSKAHRIADLVANIKGFEQMVIIGYDLLDENISYLKQGKIEFLIHQKPKRQAYLSINYFAEHFLFGKDVPSRMLLPIDIITSENVGYYLE